MEKKALERIFKKMNESRNDLDQRAKRVIMNNTAKNATTLKKYYQEFVTQGNDQRGQGKVFSPPKAWSFSNCLKEKNNKCYLYFTQR